mgnify:CR=1 FL=1
MLHKNIRKFLSNIGKRGGKRNAELHDMSKIARLGGLKKAENHRKKTYAQVINKSDLTV